MSTEFDHIWLLRIIVFPTLSDSLKVWHFVPHFFSQSPGVSKARAGRTAGPAAEPEVYSCWCGEDQQREERTPADHHQSQQVSGRCRTAQVEWRDRSGQSEGEGTPFSANVFATVSSLLVAPLSSHVSVLSCIDPRRSWGCLNTTSWPVN